MKSLLKRYEKAIKKLGGALGIMSLPEPVQEALKIYTDLETKVKILEMVIEAKKK
jgi:hypothetical protein